VNKMINGKNATITWDGNPFVWDVLFKEEKVKDFSVYFYKHGGVDGPAFVFNVKSREGIFEFAQDNIFPVYVQKGVNYLPDADNELTVVVRLNREAPEFVQLPAPEMVVRGTKEAGNERAVYNYIDARRDGVNLYGGLTVATGAGTWSSWPTHNFETESLLAPIDLFNDFYENFAFITYPQGLWGVQALDKTRGTRAVRDGDVVEIPLGPHPVCGGPGIKMAYFWFYTGGWPKFNE